MPAFVLQFIRFLGIGFLNTAVDFAVLNFLASSFGIYTGAKVGFLNAMSFSIAVLHSYFWNKYWTFNSRSESGVSRDVGKFIAASLVGIAILISVIWGARLRVEWVYYFSAFVVLTIGEIILWKAFRLSVPKSITSHGKKELLLFVVISIIGVFINSGIVAVVTGRVPPVLGFNQELWTNLVKAGATGLSLIWNFLGYKLIVFKG